MEGEVEDVLHPSLGTEERSGESERYPLSSEELARLVAEMVG